MNTFLKALAWPILGVMLFTSMPALAKQGCCPSGKTEEKPSSTSVCCACCKCDPCKCEKCECCKCDPCTCPKKAN